ncbi:MAG: cation:proton antiporter [Phycisphaeraceae bacterium]|nr:cation:proton antiporter [Phycisphaeraceae bacterium]
MHLLATTNHESATLFLLQAAVILLACRVVGFAARWLGQPQVVGEMIAGVVLGPSLLGAVAPGAFSALFPPEGMRLVYVVAQVGLSLYMFLIGLEFNIGLIAGRWRSAAAVSISGIAAPFLLGGVMALALYRNEALFAPQIRVWEAVLFMGAAMSITAFPMLARILYERGLSGTPLGTLALAAGSSDDAAAWCLLAIVLASFGGSAGAAALTIGGGVAYAVVCIAAARPALRGLGLRAERDGDVRAWMLALVLAMVMLVSWFADAIGIYSVFGAFILGVAMPRGVFADRVTRYVEPLTTTLLLPMFFVYSGLNTRIGLVDTPAMWGVAALVLVMACAGKGLACWGAARLCGVPGREAMAIGALMNARGLMELILLNIAYERGLITQGLFSVMVIMAIVTTLMATPVFELVYGRHQRKSGRLPAAGVDVPAIGG